MFREANFAGPIGLLIVGAVLAFLVPSDAVPGFRIDILGFIVGGAGLLWTVLEFLGNGRNRSGPTDYQ